MIKKKDKTKQKNIKKTKQSKWKLKGKRKVITYLTVGIHVQNKSS